MKEVSRFHEHACKALAHPKAVLKITILGVEGGHRGNRQLRLSTPSAAATRIEAEA
jgi:hypothetical protein